MAHFLRRIPPTILAFFTKTDRYFPVAGVNFEWNPKCWTHNTFRVYELIFGRRIGVRPSVSSFPDGKGGTIEYAHSFEALIAITETAIRNALTFPQFRLVKVFVPQFAPLGYPIPAAPYLFAIAFDATVKGESGSSAGASYTLAHTCTGSDLQLTLGYIDQISSGTATESATYNSVSMTKVVTDAPFGGTTFNIGLFALASPATGANNIVFSMSPNGFATLGSMSFTGTDTGSPTGVSNHNHGSATTASQALTTNAANSVIVDCLMLNNAFAGTPGTTGSGQTEKYRQVQTAALGRGLLGSMMTTTTAGSYTPAWSWTGSDSFGICAMEVHALAAAGPANLKSYNTNLKANIKSIDTNLIANAKSLDTNV